MLFFWKSWNRESRLVYLVGLGLLTLAILLFLGAYSLGIHGYISLQTAYEFENISFIVEKFSSGLFELSIEADKNIVWFYALGDTLFTPNYLTLGYLAVTAIVLAAVLATASFLNNIGFYSLALVCSLTLVFQQPNAIVQNFNTGNGIQVVFALLPILAAYLFFAFFNKVRFITRFSILLAAIIFVYGLVYATNQSIASLYVLQANGSMAWVVLTLLFLFFIGFEPVYAMLYVVSNTRVTAGGFGTWHFIIMFLLYFLNLILQYLHNIKAIHFPVFYISPFFIFIFSTAMGIWGFRERSAMFQRTLPFYPFGAVLYLCWAIGATITMAYTFLSGNDPWTEVFEDFILLSHISMGLGFFIYVAWNYGIWLNKNAPVYKLIYSFRWVSFISVYATAALVAISLFFYSNAFTYRQAMAGYYNAMADAEWANHNHRLAEEYYKQAIGYEFQNHKSNYMLGMWHKISKQPVQALKYFEKACLKQPSELAYAHLAYIKSNELGKHLEAALHLREGVVIFPKSALLMSNLGLIYEKLGFSDSAGYYFIQSEKIQPTFEPAYANKLALLAKLGIKTEVESYPKPTLLTQVNQAALGQNKDLDIHDYKAIGAIEATKNAVLQSINKMQPLPHSFIDNFYKADSTLANHTDLLYLSALLKYYSGNALEAYKNIDALQLSDDFSAGKYLHTLGLWYLKGKAYAMAAKIFDLSYQKGYKEAKAAQAIALTEAGNWPLAVQAWNHEAVKNNPDYSLALQQFNKIVAPTSFNMLLTASDSDKYNFLHYRNASLTDAQLGNLFFSINDPYFKLKAALELFDIYYTQKMPIRCQEIIEEVKTLAAVPTDIVLALQLDYSLLTNDTVLFTELIKKKDKAINITKYSNYYFAKYFEYNQQTDSAVAYYQKCERALCLDERVMVEYARFLRNKLNDNKAAFNLLLNAVSLNPYSTVLYKEYCLQAIYYGIPDFAYSGLEHLQTLVSAKEFKEFSELVKRKEQEYRQQWN